MDPIYYFAAEANRIVQEGFGRLGVLGRRAVRVLRDEDPRMAQSLRMIGMSIMFYSRGLRFGCSTSFNPYPPDQCRMTLDTISDIGELVLLLSFSKTPFFRRFTIFVT